MLKKELTVTVILLFFGLAFAPSITGDIERISDNKEPVEITVDICGFDKTDTHKVLLTREQADRLDALFDEIRLRLDNAENAFAVFNDAVERLDELGLLGGLSVEEAQKLVNVDYEKTRFSNDSEENFDCKIVGRGLISFYDERDFLLEKIFMFLVPLYDSPIKLVSKLAEVAISFVLFINLFYLLFGNTLPYLINDDMFVGYRFLNEDYYWESHPSDIWVWTNGSNGVVEWDGELYGKLGYKGIGLIAQNDFIVFRAATNFSGIHIGQNFFGSCSHISLGSSRPD